MRNLLEALLRVKDTGFQPNSVLDIGAYIGKWSQAASVAFPEAKYLMLEAQPEAHEYLTKLKNYDPEKFDFEITLLGEENKASVPFFQTLTPAGSTGSSMYPEQTDFPQRQLNLNMQRLDEITNARPDQTFDLIKLDVQGAELDVLKGGTETLRNAHFLVVETSLFPYNAGAPLFAEVIQFLAEYGFMVMDIFQPVRDANGLLFQADMIFVRESSKFKPRITLPEACFQT